MHKMSMRNTKCKIKFHKQSITLKIVGLVRQKLKISYAFISYNILLKFYSWNIMIKRLTLRIMVKIYVHFLLLNDKSHQSMDGWLVIEDKLQLTHYND
jgi:hypothetical protein